MTIGTTYQPAVYTASGGTVFSFSFELQDASHLRVELDGVITSTGFTTTLNADQIANPGGFVTFSVAPTSGVVVDLEIGAPIQRTNDYQGGAAFNADNVDSDQDYQTICMKKLASRLDRAPAINPRYGVLGPLEFPWGLADGLVKVNAAQTALELVTAQTLLGFSVQVNTDTLYVNTISNLKALAAGVQTYVHVGGYYATGDGGGGLFYWDAALATADNGGNIIQPNSLPASGRWRRTETGIVSTRQFGAKVDGATNDTTAINNALACGVKLIYASPGTSLADSLSQPVDTVFFGAGGLTSCIRKRSNNDMLTMAARSTLRGIYLDGQGATFTGTGVKITTGAVDNNSWRYIIDCHILDTASYGIEFTADLSGYASKIRGGSIVPHTAAVAAVKMPAGPETNGNRSIVDVWTFGNPIADLAGSATTLIEGGTQGQVPIMSADTQKAIINGCRLVATSWTVIGTSHVITGNDIGFSGAAELTFDAALFGSTFEANQVTGVLALVDDCAGDNQIHLASRTAALTWTATAGTAPDIGNGTAGIAITRTGQNVKINGFLNVGSTTVTGNGGNWQFTMPYVAARSCTGSAYIEDSGTTRYIGLAKITAGSALMELVDNAVASLAAFNSPMTWANGDKLLFDLDYQIES